MHRWDVPAPVRVKPQPAIILAAIVVVSACHVQIAARVFRSCAVSRLLTGRLALTVEATRILCCDPCHRESDASAALDSTNLPMAGPGEKAGFPGPTRNDLVSPPGFLAHAKSR